MIGVIQTGDVNDAIATAEKYLRAGGHILVSRHEYNNTDTDEDIEKSEEYRLSDGHFGRPLGHEAIEYEVYVDRPFMELYVKKGEGL